MQAIVLLELLDKTQRYAIYCGLYCLVNS